MDNVHKLVGRIPNVCSNKSQKPSSYAEHKAISLVLMHFYHETLAISYFFRNRYFE